MSNKRTSTLVLIFVVYFLVHALIRTALGWSLTADEYAIMQDARRFSWIYDGEMPLYAWLQSSIINTFGPTVLSLTLLKNIIMLMICLTVFTLVERVSNTAYAFAAALSLLFLPQIAWTSQHALTAPVLATLFAATTLLAFSRLSDEKSVPRYGILGAMIGLGAISSTTYLLVPAALMMAAVTSASHRNIVFNRHAFAVVMVAGSIACWPYYKLFQSGAFLMPDVGAMYSLGMDLMMDRARGIYQALQTMLKFSSLLIVGAAITVYSGLGRNQPINKETKALRELLLRTVSIGLLLVFGIAFIAGSGWMNQASLQPLLFLAAPVLALYLFPAMSTKTHRHALSVSGVIAIIVLVVTPAHYSFGDRLTGPVQQASYTPVAQ